MTDNEKLFVVFYVGCKGMDDSVIPKFMVNFMALMDGKFDETIKPLYVTDRDVSTTRIEVINPRYVSESEYKSVIERFEKIVDKYEKQKETPTGK